MNRQRFVVTLVGLVFLGASFFTDCSSPNFMLSPFASVTDLHTSRACGIESRIDPMCRACNMRTKRIFTGMPLLPFPPNNGINVLPKNRFGNVIRLDTDVYT